MRIAKLLESLPMTALIYRPAKSAMQSGRGNTHEWVLEHEASSAKRADPLMGWQGGQPTLSQIRLRFSSKEAAIAYAEKEALDYTVQAEQPRALKLQSYADNFR
jgi:ETC complex I subunit conserved region